MIPTTLIAEFALPFFRARAGNNRSRINHGATTGGLNGLDIAQLCSRLPSKGGDLSRIHNFRLLLKEVTAS
jgi:hypothetical protein